MTALILTALIHRTVLTVLILTERVVEAEPDEELVRRGGVHPEWLQLHQRPRAVR